MGLNVSKGNMYPFVTHTWNAIKGACPHGCPYCYMLKWKQPQKEPRLVESEFNTDLGMNNFIFVGSSIDMFADAIPDKWILRTLHHCVLGYPNNRFLFQSKNPERMREYLSFMPRNSILATTIETNRHHDDFMCRPDTGARARAMARIRNTRVVGKETMCTIEPIMDFDLDELVEMISQFRPKWVVIGANTADWLEMPEPSKAKVDALIDRLNYDGVAIKLKDNLQRILKWARNSK